jgi:hypothetical protein
MKRNSGAEERRGEEKRREAEVVQPCFTVSLLHMRSYRHGIAKRGNLSMFRWKEKGAFLPS